MAEEKTFSVGVQTSSPKRISVTSNVSENPITASADTGLYYSQLAKNWAIGEGLIQNEDYSSKTWAAESKSSADLSKMYSEAASLDYNNLSEAINQYNEQISGVVAEGVDNINTSVTDGVSRLEETTETNITEINATLSEIDTVKTNAVNEVKAEGQIQLNNIKSTGFYMRDDKLYFINSEGVEEEFKSGGGGLEIGDIGIAPLGIDETENKRRYINGQLIIQEQFVSFTQKLKKAVELNPSLACTEEQWQATVIMSAFGQCGKFVIDDEAGTIRLPKITGFIQGLTDLASLGELVEAGLPNITGSATLHSSETANIIYSCAGAIYGTGGSGTSYRSPANLTQVSGAPSNGAIHIDASRSSSIYGNSNTAQPESIRYPYFIQVATGSEESVDVTREIELNNPYSLLDVKWSDKLLNNVSWLRSQGQANSKAVYNDVYELILKEYNSGTDETETVGGVSITFRRGSETNIKVTTNKSAYDSILSATGTAWYYVLDTANETFYLPQSDGFLQFGGNGEFVEAGLPNITGDFGQGNYWYLTDNANGAFVANTGGNQQLPTNSGSASSAKGVSFNASRCSDVYGKSNTVQPNAVKGYLYFYVGETVQNANLINAGRIEEIVSKINADKLDKSAVKAYIIETYVNGTSGYRIWSDGYCEQWGYSTGANSSAGVTISYLKQFSNQNYNIVCSIVHQEVNNSILQVRIVSKDVKTFNALTIYRNQNNTPGYGAYNFQWFANGYLATGQY